jgi:hypothetical protein
MERQLAQQVVHEWNVVNSQDRAMVLLPVAWETHAAPAMGERGQEIINQQLVRDCDMLVAMFWTRIGTPTGQSPSGSVEEVEEHILAGKPVMLYFSAAPVRPDSVDEHQFRSLQQFKDSCRERGLIQEYESVTEFREKFARQLAQTIVQRFHASAIEGGPISEAERASTVATRVSPGPIATSTVIIPSRPLTLDERDLIAALPDESRELLVAAAADPTGTVLMTQTMGGMSVETNERDFVERSNPRSEARWRRAVGELVEMGLLQRRDLNGEVFSVTDEGYRAADLLSRMIQDAD